MGKQNVKNNTEAIVNSWKDADHVEGVVRQMEESGEFSYRLDDSNEIRALGEKILDSTHVDSVEELANHPELLERNVDAIALVEDIANHVGQVVSQGKIDDWREDINKVFPDQGAELNELLTGSLQKDLFMELGEDGLIDEFVEFDDDALDDENSFLEGTSNGLIDEFVEFDDDAFDDENSFLEGTSKGRTLYDEITASEEPP